MTIAIIMKVGAPAAILAAALALAAPHKEARIAPIGDLLERLDRGQARAAQAQAAPADPTIAFENGIQVARLVPD